MSGKTSETYEQYIARVRKEKIEHKRYMKESGFREKVEKEFRKKEAERKGGKETDGPF